jgi:drug/metabolite transporter (DMT)-like permease
VKCKKYVRGCGDGTGGTTIIYFLPLSIIQRKRPIKTIIAYAAIYIVWGSTYLFIKFAVHEINPFLLVGMRFFLGGMLLLLFTWKAGYLRKPPSLLEIRNSIITGTLLLLGGNGLVSLAQTRVESYIAALIISSTPVAVMMIDTLLLRKKPPVTGWIGAILGFCGIALLFHRHGASFSLSWFMVILFAAVTFWALGTSLSKVLALPGKSAVNSGIQQTAIGIGALSGIAVVSPSSLAVLPHISPIAWTSILYLAVMGSAALAAYAYLLSHEPNHRIVTYALVNPLIAIILGLTFGREHPVAYLVPGTIMILSGLALMFYGERTFLMLKRMKQPPV